MLFMFQRPELLVTRTYDDGKTMDHIRSHCSEEVPVNRQRTLSAHSGRALLDTVRQLSYYAPWRFGRALTQLFQPWVLRQAAEAHIVGSAPLSLGVGVRQAPRSLCVLSSSEALVGLLTSDPWVNEANTNSAIR